MSDAPKAGRQSIYSPVDGSDYELGSDGLVTVTERSSGHFGRFSRSGKWVSGALRSCDLNMLIILKPRSAVPFVALAQQAEQAAG